jgi:hypothetical protein
MDKLDSYTHKLTKENLTLKKDYGNFAVFWIDKPIANKFNTIIDIAICQWVNIEINNKQLKLF